jgi:enamine deaminase RidA (YjgF/YER057c/UK114 family)
MERNDAMQAQAVNPWTWQEAFGYAQANLIGEVQQVLLCSGQLSMDASGSLTGAGDMEAQVSAVMDNLATVLEAAGFSLADVVKLTIYTTDVDTYLQSHGVVTGQTKHNGRSPAMTLIGVSRLAFPELLVEIEAIAAK